MPRPEPDQVLVPSVLDRLIDPEPGGTSRSLGGPSGDLAGIKGAVKRDLEWLLNSRQPVADLPADLRHVQRSLLTYGLPDLTATALSNTREREALRRAVEGAVARFEPRLTRVVVTLVEGRELDRALRFRIDAMLNVEPEPEPVAFDSVLQLSTRAFVVQGE